MILHVLLVSEIRRHREALADALRRYPDVCLINAVSDPRTARDLADDLRPDVVLIDSPSHAAMEAFSGARASPVLFIGSPARSVVLGTPTSHLHLAIGEDPSIDDLYCRALSLICAHNLISDDSRKRLPRPASDLETVTQCEQEIAELVTRGLSNKEIALHLNVSTLTVKNHVHHILKKLGLQRRGQLAALCRNREYSFSDLRIKKSRYAVSAT